MKIKQTTLWITILFFVKANASVLTVSNWLASPSQYAQIDQAIAAANPGDTIYVSGSFTQYNNCTINKSLVLIGAGTFTQKQNNVPVTIASIYIASNTSNIVISGFKITTDINANNKNNINNIKISFNTILSDINFGGLSNSTNIIISSNVIGSGGFSIALNSNSNVNNVTIENNIITSPLQGIGVNNAILQNNVFYNVQSGIAINSFGVTNASFSNNIFYNSNPLTNAINCTYLNNLTYSNTASYPILTGSGNIDNTDPLFNNVATSGGYVSTYNFGLQALSPALNAGTDGKDLGIYGGSAFVSLFGEAYYLPVIRQMLLLNSNVPQNGNVNVKVRSSRAR